MDQSQAAGVALFEIDGSMGDFDLEPEPCIDLEEALEQLFGPAVALPGSENGAGQWGQNTVDDDRIDGNADDRIAQIIQENKEDWDQRTETEENEPEPQPDHYTHGGEAQPFNEHQVEEAQRVCEVPRPVVKQEMYEANDTGFPEGNLQPNPVSKAKTGKGKKRKMKEDVNLGGAAGPSPQKKKCETKREFMTAKSFCQRKEEVKLISDQFERTKKSTAFLKMQSMAKGAIKLVTQRPEVYFDAGFRAALFDPLEEWYEKMYDIDIFKEIRPTLEMMKTE